MLLPLAASPFNLRLSEDNHFQKYVRHLQADLQILMGKSVSGLEEVNVNNGRRCRPGRADFLKRLSVNVFD